MKGSSPLTRGKRLNAGTVDRAGGLIPAHAGKTAINGWRASRMRAHPRSRGENPLGGVRVSPFRGSSPLTRGKRNREQGTGKHTRLIPAHAGKTRNAAANSLESRAHPRSRGENLNGDLEKLGGSGSSPLTRGKRMDLNDHGYRTRLIPAHAGKTGRRGRPRSRAGAHPRSRGENVTVSEGWEKLEGSSPLTRGKRGVEPFLDQGCGLIPAHAGKTQTRAAGRSTRRAHPRSRGENGRA